MIVRILYIPHYCCTGATLIKILYVLPENTADVTPV